MNSIHNMILIGIGILLGFIVARLISRSQKNNPNDLKEQLEQSRKELNAYREQVNEHFNTSAQLLENLAQQYQQIHQHMAEQAQVLMSSENEKSLLFEESALLTSAADSQNCDEPKPSSPPKDYSNQPSGLLASSPNYSKR
ncbi:MAG: Inner membrane protein YhcB [Candidatus Celerinatantimonas neptuna]|nr:MAG: Inner membrane protein YhcB [Candidatus Celerinatantimonas neptuna]